MIKEHNNFYSLRGLLFIALGLLLDAGASIMLEIASGKVLTYTGYGVSFIASVLYVIGIIMIKSKMEYFRRAKICIMIMLALSALVFLVTVSAFYFGSLMLGTSAAVIAIGLVAASLLMVYNIMRGCSEIGEDQLDENHEIMCNRVWMIYVIIFGASYVVGGLSAIILGDSSTLGAAISAAMTYIGAASKLLVGLACWLTYKKFNGNKINAY